MAIVSDQAVEESEILAVAWLRVTADYTLELKAHGDREVWLYLTSLLHVNTVLTTNQKKSY